ncbi:hypothetical protein ABZ851_34170 [Streptomyces sp. NPDC047049]|uniref:hypothetical protein n=1 Tax=Streptomyces sp. NPDC047049 TaxID=3156688 RepID=UPI003406BFF4
MRDSNGIRMESAFFDPTGHSLHQEMVAVACSHSADSAPMAEDSSLSLSSEEFQTLWADWRPIKRETPFVSTMPVVLNGKLVQDIERIDEEYPEDLFVTPVVHDSELALAVFADPKQMLAEARKTKDDAEFHWLVEQRGIGCLPDGAPALTALDSYDIANLGGRRLRISPEHGYPDLSLVPRRKSLNWDNAILSFDACAYPFSASSEKDFHGITHFQNFRCGFNISSDWSVSSLINWGTLPPDY